MRSQTLIFFQARLHSRQPIENTQMDGIVVDLDCDNGHTQGTK